MSNVQVDLESKVKKKNKLMYIIDILVLLLVLSLYLFGVTEFTHSFLVILVLIGLDVSYIARNLKVGGDFL